MNKTTEALKLAEEAANRVIEALEYLKTIGIHPDSLAPAIRAEKKALAAIREALAEQDKQEPVAVISESAIGLVKLHSNGACLPFGTQLYTEPVSVEAIREERTKELMQLFLDPENQPTQFGTATLEYREEEHKAIRAEALEEAAKVCDFENHQLTGMRMDNEAWAAKNCAAAIRGLK